MCGCQKLLFCWWTIAVSSGLIPFISNVHLKPQFLTQSPHFYSLQADHKLSYALTHCNPQREANIRFGFGCACHVWFLSTFQ